MHDSVLEQVNDVDGTVGGAREASAVAATVQPVHTRDRTGMARDGHHRSQITLLSHLMKNGNHLFLQLYNTLITYNGSPLNLNTNGPEKSLHISEQALFWAMQELFLGKDNVSEVSSFLGCVPLYHVCRLTAYMMAFCWAQVKT